MIVNLKHHKVTNAHEIGSTHKNLQLDKTSAEICAELKEEGHDQ